MSRTRILICDLDGTLVGDERATAAFARWYAATRPSVRLVYATGRLTADALALLREQRLPRPDALIGGVGTEIVRFDGTGRRRRLPWSPRRWSAAAVRRVLSATAGLELQPEQYQSPWKVSYYARRFTAARLEAVRHRLAEAVAATVVYSSDRDLDVLPRGIDKGTAAARLVRRWRSAVEHVVVCGDTGNDLALFQHGYCGVVVGNARPELRRVAGPDAFQAAERFAGGVLEGLRHWWPDLAATRPAARRTRRVEPA